MPAPPEVPVTIAGDLWLLGNHKVLAAFRLLANRSVAWAECRGRARTQKLALINMAAAPQDGMNIGHWPIEKFVHYARNPRKNDAAVDRMVSSLKEFGFAIKAVVCTATKCHKTVQILAVFDHFLINLWN